MTVKELIDILSKKDPNVRVILEKPWGDQYGSGIDYFDISHVSRKIDTRPKAAGTEVATSFESLIIKEGDFINESIVYPDGVN